MKPGTTFPEFNFGLVLSRNLDWMASQNLPLGGMWFGWLCLERDLGILLDNYFNMCSNVRLQGESVAGYYLVTAVKSPTRNPPPLQSGIPKIGAASCRWPSLLQVQPVKSCTAAQWNSPVPPELLLFLCKWSKGQLGHGFCPVNAMQHFRGMFLSPNTIAAPYTYREKKAFNSGMRGSTQELLGKTLPRFSDWRL